MVTLGAASAAQSKLRPHLLPAAVVCANGPLKAAGGRVGEGPV